MARGTSVEGLSHFVADLPSGRLLSSERRHIVDVSDVPEEHRYEFEKRLVIEDTATGTTRFEVDWSFRQSLWPALDMASVGWQKLHSVFS